MIKERYIGINSPLKTITNRERSTVKSKLKILFIWLLAILLSSPVIILTVQEPSNIMQNQVCTLYNRHFILWGSIVSFIIPCIVMVLMYALTVRKLSKILKDYQYQKANRCERNPKHFQLRKNTRSDSNADKMLKSYRLNSIMHNKSRMNVRKSILRSPSQRTRLRTDSSKSPFAVHLSIPSTSPLSRGPSSSDLKNNSKSNKNPSSSESVTRKPTLKGQSGIDQKQGLTPNAHLIKNAIKKLNGTQVSIKNEQKAVQVLGIVFFVFFIAWIPFATANILSLTREVDAKLMDILVWLGYVSSCINPLIYNAFNENFRRAFREILTCKLEYSNSYVKSRVSSTFNSNKTSSVNKNLNHDTNVHIV